MCFALNIRGRSKLMWYWWYAHLLQFMYFMESLVREHWDCSFHCCLKWIPHRHNIYHVMFIFIGTWEIIILASAFLHCYLQWPSLFYLYFTYKLQTLSHNEIERSYKKSIPKYKKSLFKICIIWSCATVTVIIKYI